MKQSVILEKHISIILDNLALSHILCETISAIFVKVLKNLNIMSEILMKQSQVDTFEAGRYSEQQKIMCHLQRMTIL
jgi:hypothetical protein